MIFMPDLYSFLPVADSAIYYAFKNTDLMGQGIVVVLLLFSVFTWTVMLEKLICLHKAKADTIKFITAFREKRNPLSLNEKAQQDPSPAARIYEAGFERVKTLHLEVPGGGRRALNDVEVEVVRSALDQSIADQILILEEKMMFLATAVSASPFLGLFGTVWGITLAFTGLAITGKADIATLAPGVSGALLTTVVGLIVAIPSLVGYNIITILIKRVTVYLDNFIEEYIAKLKMEQLESTK